MKLYCMCKVKNNKPDGQEFMAPNRFGNGLGKSGFRPVALIQPMKCLKNGVEQITLEYTSPNDWTNKALPFSKRHYPNVLSYY